jgi:hypothetical protein
VAEDSRVTEPTYADVAKWLPTDIREAIEAALPCPVGDKHRWRHDRTEIRQWESDGPVAVRESWNCRWCGLVHTTNPDARA